MVYIALFIVTSVNNNFKNKDMVSSLFDLAATSLERSYQKYHDYVKQPNDDNYINLMMEIKNLSRNIDYLHKAITSKKITTNDCAPDEIKRQYLAYKKETTDLPTSRKAQQTGILTCNASVMYSNLHRELILNKLRLYS
ncbi:hypothetical protein EPN96_12315 [bacterium]|nr:MAG: hypothetical protein EPN96_12315 [bacterium]